MFDKKGNVAEIYDSYHPVANAIHDFENIAIGKKNYPQWLARYTDVLDYPYRFEMWQYTSSGTVPGVNGPCDINILFPYDW